MADDEMIVIVTGTDEFDVSEFQRIDMDELRQRANPLMPDGQHAWVIHVVYGIDDPDQALDDMELDADKFIGLTAIHCLICKEDYVTGRRHHKCPGAPR